MRASIVYVLIALLYKVESHTFCDDPKCVCIKKDNSSIISCNSHPNVLEENYDLPNNITTLDLSLNNITSLQRPLVSNKLIGLLLSSNRIKKIAFKAFNLPSLKILDLSDNDLEFIHRDTFAQIKNLENLNLSKNKFNKFENINFYYLRSLREIVFDDNNIGPVLENHSLFEGGFDLANEIEVISLCNTNLTSMKNLFLERQSLKKLSLAQNNINQIEDLPYYLEYLDVSNNPIKNISYKEFFDVIEVTTLKLNNILIEEIPDFAFHFFTLLTDLELQGNTRLKRFSPLAWGRVIVKDQIDLFVTKLNLRGGNFTSLDGQLEGIFKKIKGVDLRDNPWHCDCELAWLLNVGIPDDLADFRCATPQNLFNRRVLDLEPSEFICEEEKPPHYVDPSVLTVVYCILLATAIVVMYLFVFSPKPLIYRKLPIEFPRTP